MLKLKRLMWLLSILFLFNAYNLNTITPFNALATEVVESKNTEVKYDNEMDLIKSPIEVNLEKNMAKELENNNAKEKEEINIEPEKREFILTFYTSLECENSSAGAVTCQNKPLIPGGVANNVIPQNSKLYLDGYGQVIVNDKGSHKYFDQDNRLDVYVAREPGESDKQYSHRVNSYGVQKVQGYIIN